MRQRIAGFIYFSIANASILLGSIYLVTPQFMWYHRQGIETDWSDLSPQLQILILALMKVTGAGWIAMGVAILILLYFCFSRGQLWARWAIPFIGLIFYGPALYVTAWFTLNTAGTAPWYGSLIAVILLLLGFIIHPANPFSINYQNRD